MDIDMENLVNLKRFILSKRNAKWQDVNKHDNKAKNAGKFISFKWFIWVRSGEYELIKSSAL